MVTGSLQERNGKYTVVLNTYENGKRKQKSRIILPTISAYF